MMLLEVLVSALLVSVIAMATFAGLEGAGKAGAQVRTRAEATKLAQEDEERLRGLTGTQLAELAVKGSEVRPEVKVGPGCKTASLGNCTAFTITSSAHFASAEKNAITCETTGAAANYIQTTSSVRWTGLAAARPSITQSSIQSTLITGLQVRVKNQNEAGVEGATVTLSGADTGTQTTPASGCVLFIGLTAGSVTVTVTKSGWVEESGKALPSSKTATVVAEKVATSEFKIGNPGSIKASFEGDNASKVKVPVESDTFIAEHNGISSPEQYLGGTAVPAAGNPTTFVLSATTPTTLFPFTKPEKPTYPPEPWTVYAGTCTAENPKTVTSNAVLPAEGKVEPGLEAKVVVEAPPLNIIVYEGSEKETVTENKPKPLTQAKAEAAKTEMEVVFPECATAPAQNVSSNIPDKHNKLTFTTSSGELLHKNWPYAKKLEFCVYAELASGKWYKYLNTSVENKAVTGSPALPVYLKEPAAKGNYTGPVGSKPSCP